ncbi:hypothetical protein D915_000294 [Fasciola hepatica]|uniref:Transmembrane protein n=1 Tax=Fasciola hepatica TaxID=6192 RepID=A0A4E0S481_FASHE|nr:hypothetical protein D915_000294 [Fasciola hepatica]
MVRSDRYAAKTKKRPRRCALATYHTGSVILFIGIVVSIVGVCTNRLFHVYVYDHRKPARFLHVHIPVGLFSQAAEVTWLSLAQEKLTHNLELDDSQWIGARALAVVGILAAICAFVIHIVISCLQLHRKWSTVLMEVCSLLLAVIAILISLSLAESEIEVIHDQGDNALTRLLVSNRLLLDNDMKALQAMGQDSGVDLPQTEIALSEEATAVDTSSSAPSTISGGDFALFLSPPQTSFALLIAAEFLILLAFLAVLIYFVRVCEKAEEARKQMRRAEIGQI